MKVYEIMSAIESLPANLEITIRDINNKEVDFGFVEDEEGNAYFGCDCVFQTDN